MAIQGFESASDVLSQPELIGLIFEKVDSVRDLLNCACVNQTWNCEALRKLYHGSLHDRQFCSPDIGSLNCLLTADRGRFARNMSFAKHLLICPDALTIDEAARSVRRLACTEKFRALRRRSDAELLFQTETKRLQSITIPVELIDQSLFGLSDLLLSDNVKYLAIDITYCNSILDSLDQMSNSPQLTGTATCHLQALTIYYPSSNDDIGTLCQVLRNCNLQFLHLENQLADRGLPRDAALGEKLFSCIERQGNLTSLALKSIHCHIFRRPRVMDFDSDVAWPSLRALYVEVCNQTCFELLPKFKEIRIVVFNRDATIDNHLNHQMVGHISMCPNLQVLDLGQYKIRNATLLPKLAQSCPQLKKLCLGISLFPEENKPVNEIFKSLVHYLARLEFLTLYWKCRMGVPMLLDLAVHCPRLVVLNLPETRLCISLTDLKSAHSLSKLQTMKLRTVWFADPHNLLQPDKLKDLAVVWRKVFPGLRIVPCSADKYSKYWDEDIEDIDNVSEEELDLEIGDASEEELDLESGDASEEELDLESGDISEEEIASQEPPLDFDDHGSRWFLLRVLLWRTLGYERESCHIDKLLNMWQFNLEIDIIKWPVVPFEAFLDSTEYSTSDRVAF